MDSWYEEEPPDLDDIEEIKKCSTEKIIHTPCNEKDLKIQYRLPEKQNGKLLKFDHTEVFRISKLHYNCQFLYIFLTGLRNIQFYFKAYCTIYSYKLCPSDHRYRSCNNKMCKPYKNMVVTGLKTHECERIYVMKVERSKCEREKYLLDDFCSDINRVQMQHNIHEGDYVCFRNGISVNERGCATGNLNDLQQINVLQLQQPIDLIVAIYDLETHTDGVKFSNPKYDCIISVSLVIKKQQNETINYCLLNTEGRSVTFDDECEQSVGNIIVVPFDNERAMLIGFFELIFLHNPDELVDYNGDSFDLPYLIERVRVLGLDEKIVKRYDLPHTTFTSSDIRTKFGYVLKSHSAKYLNHTDVYQYIKSSVDNSKMENMKLDTVANHYLGVGKVDLNIRDMMKLRNEGCMNKVVKYNVRDSILAGNIFSKLQVANKLFADASILNLSRDDYLRTISHKINLALFYHAMNNTHNDQSDPYFFNKFDLNKIMSRNNASDEENLDMTKLRRNLVPTAKIPSNAIKLCPIKTNIKYVGGKVLSPVPGYYGLTFTLDFSQLYTCIMIAETTCLSNLFFGTDGYLYLQKNENAITTKFLKEMARKRAEWKGEMKKCANDDFGRFMYDLYDSWQNTAKLTCNSQYGWFGMFCKALANHITAIGRQKLTDAKNKIEAMSNNPQILKKWGLESFELKVVYGDTDSNFVNINMKGPSMSFDQLRTNLLEDVVKPLNASWNGDYKMELENIMQCMLLNGKKSYVCLKENGTMYKRGLNVKKDVPLILRQVFDSVLMNILQEHSLDCVLSQMVNMLQAKKDTFSMSNKDEYSFSQTLNKSIEATNPTIACKLYVMLKESALTREVPGFGDRIPYLLLDKPGTKNVRDKVIPTQLFNEDCNLNWSKHLGIICTFLNYIMSMIENDDLFVLAFNNICEYLQRDQVHDCVYYVFKKMTSARTKDLVCKELNIKDKKKLPDTEFSKIVSTGSCNIKHSYEFVCSKIPPKYKLPITSFSKDCPRCNNRGVSAVKKNMRVTINEGSCGVKRNTAPDKKTIKKIKI
ncbi:DNA polymerase [Hyphantria cunea granulovirus]|uniref:DNA-directed DNA polymerase n=1 Tax=Hyphantria cunea granulovirus TaxID=307448 RepID=A0AAE6D0N0_9BBAC|nr:DNA polymerase [Hyphantria cunea granulovirus]QBQ01650.1 DNA polymerase [Hyphantria cunea granulovirus]